MFDQRPKPELSFEHKEPARIEGSAHAANRSKDVEVEMTSVGKVQPSSTNLLEHPQIDESESKLKKIKHMASDMKHTATVSLK